jgi:hypothetical protein
VLGIIPAVCCSVPATVLALSLNLHVCSVAGACKGLVELKRPMERASPWHSVMRSVSPVHSLMQGHWHNGSPLLYMLCVSNAFYRSGHAEAPWQLLHSEGLQAPSIAQLHVHLACL